MVIAQRLQAAIASQEEQDANIKAWKPSCLVNPSCTRVENDFQDLANLVPDDPNLGGSVPEAWEGKPK